jgi:uncharacterized protein (DUF433 family)
VLDCLRNGRSIENILQSYPSISRPAVQEAIRLATKALTGHYVLQAA